MSETIGTLFVKIKEEKRLTKKQVCGGLVSEDDYQNIVTEKSEGNVWILRILIGRLHIQEAMVAFYLDKKENEMINLEIEIYRRIMVWNEKEAKEKLDQFYVRMDKNSSIQWVIYYRLFLLVYKENSILDKGQMDMFHNKLDEVISVLEDRISLREAAAPEELALLTEYYDKTITDITVKRAKLYDLLDYYKTEYRETELLNRFYAQLCFYYAKTQFALGRYHHCINSCRDGLKITEEFGCCNNTAELYELMAEAKSRIFKEVKKLGPKKNKEEYAEMVQWYQTASTLYTCFYGELADQKVCTIKERIQEWKTTKLQ